MGVNIFQMDGNMLDGSHRKKKIRKINKSKEEKESH